MYGMTPIGVFFLAVFPPRPPNQGFCQQLHFLSNCVLIDTLSAVVGSSFLLHIAVGQ